jgi:molecular chaperone DnaK
MPKAVGIDLGTTNSVVSVLEAGDPTGDPQRGGRRAPPRPSSRSRRAARSSSARSPSARPSPTPTAPSGRSSATWAPTGRSTSTARATRPQEISARTLHEAQARRRGVPGRHRHQAVITVPAYFNDAQRTGHQGGGPDRRPRGAPHHQRAHRRGAGLRPRREGSADQTILVFDLGGGTFDVSVLEIGDGVFEVKATHGDNHLGGDDWDQAIIDWMVQKFKDGPRRRPV